MKENMKHLTSIIIGACIVLACFVLVKSCQVNNLEKNLSECELKKGDGHFEKYVVKRDTIREIVDLNDSIKEIHQEEVNTLKTRLKIAKSKTDTVRIIQVQESIIVQQDTIIKYLEKNDTLQKQLIAIQDTTLRKQHGQIEVLQEENKSEKKKKRKAVIVATISTATAIFTTIKAINK